MTVWQNRLADSDHLFIDDLKMKDFVTWVTFTEEQRR